MTRREFLSELRMALEGNIPVQDIEDNIRYMIIILRKAVSLRERYVRSWEIPG